MATPFRLKRSAVTGKRPALADLQTGELALNTNDAFLFAKRDTGGVGIGTTVTLLTPWTENFGGGSIFYANSVGIGITNPSTKLDVDGEITIRRTAAGSEGGQVNFARALDNTVAYSIDVFGDTASNARLRFIDNVAGAERATIDRSGNFIINSGSSTGTVTQALQINSGAYISGLVGIATTNPTSRLHVIGDALVSGVVTATTFIGALTGIAASATKLVTPRTFEITGDVVASAISFDGTGNVSFAATIQPNSVGLGTDTTGDYVQSLTGTANQITVTGGTGETSNPVLSFPNQLTVPQDLTVTRDVQINRNLNVNGNITIGGTSATLFTSEFKVFDPDIVLGFRTDALNNDVSTDSTASHGGIAIASTEGTPLVQLFIAGIETNPATYKKFMWFKAGEFSGLGTDAWLSNYAIGIGSTQVPNGVRLAAGSVQITQNDLSVVRNINASGIVTATTFSGQINAGVGTITTLSGTTGTITNLSSTNLSGTIGTITTLTGTTGTITNLSSTNLSGTIGTITTLSGTTGTITNLSSTNLSGTIGTIATLSGTTGTITNLSSTNLSGTIGTITTLNSTNGTVTNLSGTIGTITTLNGTTGTITNLSSTNLSGTIGTITTLSGTTGTITTLNSTNGTVTNLSGTIGTITTLSGTTGTITNLTSTNLSGTIGTITTLNSTNGTVTNLSGTIGTITTLSGTTGTITNLTSTNLSGTIGTVTNLNSTQLNVSGVITATGGIQGIGIQSGGVNITTGILTALNFVGAGNSFSYNAGTKTIDINIGGGQWTYADTSNTTTSSIYRLNGNVGLGTTNPTSKLHVIGDALITGVLTATNGIRGIGIQSGGVSITTGIITTLNFTGSAVSTITNSSGLVTIDLKASQFSRTTTSFTATAGQTTFSVTYTPNFIDVFLNGVRLTSAEFTATNGTSVVLTDGANAGDTIDVVVFQNSGLFDSSKWTAADAGNPISGNIFKLNGNVGIATSNPTSKLHIVGDALVSGVVTATSFSGGFNIGIQSAGTNITTGVITALNFIGAGNSFTYNAGTKIVDINIGGAQWTYADTTNTTTSNIYRLNGNVGIATTNPIDKLDVSGILGVGGTITGITTTDPTTIDTLPITRYRSARFQVQITQSTNYQSTDLMVIHDGSTSNIIEYGSIATNDYLASFTSTVSGSNLLLQATMGSAGIATVKVVRYGVTV